MQGLKLGIAAAAVSAGALLGGAVTATPAQAKDIVINMAAPDWLPTRFMQEEFNRSYKAKSGNSVKLVIDFIPWPSFYQRVAASLSSGEKKYQMIVTDSQWMGDFVEGGHYLKLNKYIEADPELQAVIADMHQVLKDTSSSYPYKNTNYYGFPQFPDNLVTFYRTDLFCNAKERTAFKAKYKKALPCAYHEWQDADWQLWGNIGEFFTRKKGSPLGDGVADDDFYGIAYQAGKGYDFSSMQINSMVWEAGGDIWDETSTKPAQGVVNSPIAIKATENYLDLLKWAPPVAKTGQMDIFVIQDLYMQGKVAAIVDWVGVAGPVLDPKASKVATKSAFAQAPGTRKADGSVNRFANIGGQPFVLTTWNNDEIIHEALDVVKWWLSTPTQTKFVKEGGGQSGMLSVLNDPAYATWSPFARAFADNIQWQKDIWHIPEFFPLLTQQQEQFDKMITGQISPKQALDTIAAYQDKTLKEAGRIK
jgi:multiple sugar transport system substrate-binding protein